MQWLIFSLLNSFFESVSAGFSKSGAQKIDVLSAAWSLRFFSLFILVPLAFLTNSFAEISSSFFGAVFLSAILNTVTTIMFMKAIKDSPISLVAPVSTFTPVFLLITSPLILGEFPKPLGIVGILSVVIGSYVLNLSKRKEGIFEPILAIFKESGVRLIFLVAFIWSITSNIDKIGIKNSNPIIYSAFANLGIMFFLTLILWFRRISFLRIFKNIPVLAPIGLTNGISYAFYAGAISMTLVANAISVKRTSSLFSIVWGRIFFKEEKIGERLIGAVIMILGVVLIALS